MSIWVEQGTNFPGLNNGELQGTSISTNDACNVFVTGVPFFDTNKGTARVYFYNGSSWVRRGSDANLAGQTGDYQGISVSMNDDGTTIVLGAYGNNSFTGIARVYQWNGTSWDRRGDDTELTGITNSDFQGSSVSINMDGTIIIIGASGYDGNKGIARVYHWNGTTWDRRGDDTEMVGLVDDRQGAKVDINNDGTVVVIGAYGHDTNTGITRVYNWNGTSWNRRGDDTQMVGDNTNETHGGSVSISDDGNVVAAGCYAYQSSTGIVKAYFWNGTSWIRRGDDTQMVGILGDSQGESIAMNNNGTIIAVGGPGHSNLKGIVRVYQWNGSLWNQIGLDEQLEGTIDGDGQGTSVAIKNNGTILFVGVQNYDGGKGAVRVYDLTNYEPEPEGEPEPEAEPEDEPEAEPEAEPLIPFDFGNNYSETENEIFLISYGRIMEIISPYFSNPNIQITVRVKNTNIVTKTVSELISNPNEFISIGDMFYNLPEDNISLILSTNVGTDFISSFSVYSSFDCSFNDISLGEVNMISDKTILDNSIINPPYSSTIYEIKTSLPSGITLSFDNKVQASSSLQSKHVLVTADIYRKDLNIFLGSIQYDFTIPITSSNTLYITDKYLDSSYKLLLTETITLPLVIPNILSKSELNFIGNTITFQTDSNSILYQNSTNSLRITQIPEIGPITLKCQVFTSLLTSNFFNIYIDVISVLSRVASTIGITNMTESVTPKGINPTTRGPSYLTNEVKSDVLFRPASSSTTFENLKAVETYNRVQKFVSTPGKDNGTMIIDDKNVLTYQKV